MEDYLLVESERVGNYRVKVYYDTEYENPRTEWDNASHMVVDTREMGVESDDVEGVLNRLCEKYEIDNEDMDFLETIEALNEFIVIMPISMYSHSGITVWYGSPNCRWDSGYIGFGYMEHADLYGEMCGRNKKDYPYWRDQCMAVMEGEMETLDKAARGEVFGWVIQKLIEPSFEMTLAPEYDAEEWEEDDDNWDEIDSCWGYFMDSKDVLKEGICQIPKEELAIA